LLSASDDVTKNAHLVVVLGYGFWMRRFEGIEVSPNNSLMTVTGV
jgi:hypothetical protein